MKEQLFREYVTTLEDELANVQLPADVTQVVRTQIDRATRLLDDRSKPWESKVQFIQAALNQAQAAMLQGKLGVRFEIVSW